MAALALLVAACTTPSAPTTLPATTVPPVASPGTTPPTTQPPTTTTTTIPRPVTVRLEGAGRGVARAVQRFYLWVKEPTRQPPAGLPRGLVRHLRDLPGREEPLRVRGRASVAEVLGARVAVVTSGKDVLLLIDEGEGWQVVGARLTRFDKGPWYGPRSPRMVLVIGSDARPGQEPAEFRADSLHIVTSVIHQRSGAIVGIPRDAWVTNPSGGRAKITNVMPSHGPEGVLDTVRRLTGLPVEGYLLTGFAGFVDLVDAFGELSVLVPFDMADRFSKAFFEEGQQQFGGGEALAFARNRHLGGGDFTRSLHQGQLMKSGLREVQASGYLRLPENLRTLTEFASTDLPPRQLLWLGASAYELRFERVPNLVVPGGVGFVGPQSVVFLGDGASRIFADLEDGTLE